MKKLLFATSMMLTGLLSAQYPLNQNFDAVTTTGTPQTGALPAGWTSGVNSAFHVYGLEVPTQTTTAHGYSYPNACSVEMSAAHPADTLLTPMIGPITANTKLSISYRFVNKTGYPATGYQLVTGDQVAIDAYLAGSWHTGIATINLTTNPAPLTTWTTYTYTNSSFSLIAGQNIQLRMDVSRVGGDWYLDIDNFIVADNISGIEYNALNPPSLLVFPNPASETFSVWIKNYTATNSVEVSLYNYLGQKVKSMTAENALNNKVEVNTTGLSKGMYIVEVKSGNEVSKTKVQVE